MHRRRSVLSLVAVATALAVVPALAAKPAPSALPTPSGNIGHVNVGGNSASYTACNSGINGGPANAFGYILPPDDEYYTLLDPVNCDPCFPASGAFAARVAHLMLYFTEPCQIPVTISLVPAYNNAGCYQPNPFDPPLCTPVQYLIDDSGTTGACVDYGLQMGFDCVFLGPAFLKVVFDQGSCQNGRPAFCGPAGPCVNCHQWNYFPGASVPGDDLCSLLGGQGYTGFIMNVDLTCFVDPTLRGTWGKVKTIYR